MIIKSMYDFGYYDAFESPCRNLIAGRLSYRPHSQNTRYVFMLIKFKVLKAY